MDDTEYNETAEALISALRPRVPEELATLFAEMLHVGEQSMAIDELAATLVDLAVPVTPEECDALRQLLDADNEPLSRIDGLIVTEQP